jgi:hypothetical protein
MYVQQGVGGAHAKQMDVRHGSKAAVVTMSVMRPLNLQIPDIMIDGWNVALSH